MTPTVAILLDAETSSQLNVLGCEKLTENSAEFPVVKTLSDWQVSDALYVLRCTQKQLQLVPKNKKLQPLLVDFTSGATGFRGQQNVRNEMLVKAVLGRDKQHIPSVIDATAGLGRDSFILAVLGCTVQMLERNPIVSALLADGLQRFQLQDTSGAANRLSLMIGNAISDITQLPVAEVVYLDPMFPKRDKSALVKKEMQIFKDIVGPDTDSDQLLAAAKMMAQKRIVVKRPSKAEYLAGAKPTYSLSGRSSRFDIYQR